MTEKAKLALAVAGVLVAAGALAYALRPAGVPGRGRPAEIIHPQTKQRIKTTWGAVFASDPPPRQDLFTGGGWQVRIPGTSLWGYVVNEGEAHPSERAASAPAGQ